jgi:acetyl esterase/lipase
VKNRHGLLSPGIHLTADIEYRRGGTYCWKLDIAVPARRIRRPTPALVLVHGGGWCSCDKTSGMEIDLIRRFAHDGYVALSVNYRLSQDARFPAQIQDVKCAVRWLRAHARQYGVDPNAIGAIGSSAGGHLVELLGLVPPEAGLEGDGPYRDRSSAVQAVVSFCGPSDLTAFTKAVQAGGASAVRQLLAGPPATYIDRARVASPVTYVSRHAPPMLLVHGNGDETVPVAQSKLLAAKLRRAGAKDVSLVIVKGAPHGVYGFALEKNVARTLEFFRRTLLRRGRC